ncbi:PH domain-containing protein [Streptomyces sp. TRM 70351]|uniref:PH domain-containing protein n=1 Tax=Streptomyces sp. TRM 70351 TaxID=3116552 RepID=UPI002E7C123B|nr:PH domain-containing protein [Streptomyces sp. TRM 70351]MEE1931030.1 PH domain-containing protein [Streptomyces sp. TRM 70351]
MSARPADIPPGTRSGAGSPLPETSPPDAPTPPDTEAPWLRLDARMIWVDLLRVVLSQLPAVVALVMVGAEPSAVWPMLAIAAWGTASAVADAVRWATTRYRVTDACVERRSGLLVRSYRSVRRERVRSVDTDARLLQRWAKLRRVTIGAGQVNTAMEPALRLDALSRRAALDLRRLLMDAAEDSGAAADGSPQQATAPVSGPAPVPAPRAAEAAVRQEFARLRWWWVFYNMANIWAFLMAAGLLWGAYWSLAMFGADAGGWITGLADWQALGPLRTALVTVAATGALGVLGMAAAFFTEHAHFRLERVPSEDGTVLRTTRGLFTTREITRDDRRLRGATIAEPLPWRWMRMADATVVTTGLSVWSSGATILPRCTLGTARRVAAAVLAEPDSPLAAPLRRHPGAALRRRLVWAVLATAAVTAAVRLPAVAAVLADGAWWLVGSALLPAALALAVVGYRALGHALPGRYLVVRSGAVSRRTTALRRDAVSGVRVRQSLFQRRLGLATVAATTAAGSGVYAARDVAAGEAAGLAGALLPGPVDAFRTDAPPRPRAGTPV